MVGGVGAEGETPAVDWLPPLPCLEGLLCLTQDTHYPAPCVVLFLSAQLCHAVSTVLHCNRGRVARLNVCHGYFWYPGMFIAFALLVMMRLVTPRYLQSACSAHLLFR